MADNEQNVISQGLNAAKANAEDSQAQQQVEELASRLGNNAGAANAGIKNTASAAANNAANADENEDVNLV